MRKLFLFFAFTFTTVATVTSMTVFAQNASNGFPPCDQEMTTCPCNGVVVDQDLVRSGDVFMIRLEDTPIVSFPLSLE